MRPPTILAALLAGTALIVTTAAKADFVDGDRVVIIDADTVALPCAVAFRGCAEKIRILAVDAPETFHPRCPQELVSGLAAKQAAVEFLRGHQVEIIRSGRKDRFGRYANPSEPETSQTKG